MTYPRRWVDRTNEARIADLVAGTEALVLVTVRSVHRRDDAQPAHDRRGGRRRRHGPPPRRVLQPAVARAAARRRPERRPVRQGRPVPQRVADDEPGRRPDRRPHRADRADLSAEREGPAVDVGARRLGRECPRTMPSPGHRRSLPDGIRRRRSSSTAATRCARSTCRRRSTPRIRAAGAWRSTSCCVCSSSSSSGNAGIEATPSVSSTRSTAACRTVSTTPCRRLTGAQQRVIGEIDADLSAAPDASPAPR